jgi:hypothetical protein
MVVKKQNLIGQKIKVHRKVPAKGDWEQKY